MYLVWRGCNKAEPPRTGKPCQRTNREDRGDRLLHTTQWSQAAPTAFSKALSSAARTAFRTCLGIQGYPESPRTPSPDNCLLNICNSQTKVTNQNGSLQDHTVHSSKKAPATDSVIIQTPLTSIFVSNAIWQRSPQALTPPTLGLGSLVGWGWPRALLPL